MWIYEHIKNIYIPNLSAHIDTNRQINIHTEGISPYSCDIFDQINSNCIKVVDKKWEFYHTKNFGYWGRKTSYYIKAYKGTPHIEKSTWTVPRGPTANNTTSLATTLTGRHTLPTAMPGLIEWYSQPPRSTKRTSYKCDVWGTSILLFG